MRVFKSVLFMGASAIAATALLPAGLAHAQEAGARSGEVDIIITARRTEERLQDVPVAVTALTAEDIETRNIQGLEDVARFTAGFSFEDFTGPLAAPIIRGQTQTRIDLEVQNTASFFNGVYLQRGYMVDGSLLDIERIEVIKGPQSALYGRNAFSGAINYVTRAPSDEFTARLSATVGTDERLAYSASVSGPIFQDQLGFLLAYAHDEFDGTWENQHDLAAQGTGTEGNLGGYDNDAFLLALSFTPTNAFSMDLAYSRTELDREHQPSYAVSTTGTTSLFNTLTCSPRTFSGVTEFRLYCGELPATPVLAPGEVRDPGLVIDPRAYAQRGTNNVLSLTTNWDVTDSISLIHLFGYTDTTVNSRGSPARNPEISAVPAVPFSFVPLFAPIVGLTAFDSQPNGGFSSWSHEGRIEFTPESGFINRLMVGAFYSEAEDDSSSWSQWATPLSLAEPIRTFTFRNQTREDQVTAFFGLIGLDITDRLSVTGEVRYTEEELTLLARTTSPGFVPTPFGPEQPIIRTQVNTFDYVTPRITVDYALTDANLLYFSAGQGVKSGGQNVPGLDPAQDVYDPEENWTIEIGSKNDFFGGDLRVNFAAFHIDWTGIQGSVARNYPTSGRVFGVDCFTACAAPAPGSPAPVIIGNLGDAEVYGFEVEGFWRATDYLTFDYAVSYVDASYNDGQISQRIAAAGNCDGVVCALSTFNSIGQAVTGANIGGNQLERAPSIQLALGAQFDWRTESLGIDWQARADVTYQDEQFVDELNLASVPERTLLDASIRAQRGPLQARLWVKNLADEEYVTSSLFLVGTAGPGSASYVPLLGEQRTVGLTVSFDY